VIKLHRNLVALDLETTGIERTSRIVQIGTKLYTPEGDYRSIWASYAPPGSTGEASLVALVRELERREAARSVIRGLQKPTLAGFRAIREVLRFTTTARPA